MWHFFAFRLFATICIFIVCVKCASACQCGGGPRGMSAWEYAREEAQTSSDIFEGAPIKFELHWSLLTAKEGDWIPAGISSLSPRANPEPEMVITFRVQRAYKGSLGSEVQLHTGLGGGDCGALFITGFTYLVYAGGPSPDQLGVSMCSPGGWMGDPREATLLRFLRHEKPAPADLAPIKSWAAAESAEPEEQRLRAYEANRQRYAAATGRICGTLVRRDPENETSGTIAFLSTQGYSPIASTDASIKPDGSFCSPDLGPGKYYLYFVHRSEHGALAVYYPGVTDAANAIATEVSAGQTESNVVFKITSQGAYSVHGFIFADEKPVFGADVAGEDVTVVLIRTDGDRRVWYNGKASFISKLGYFKIENVVPGRYYAFVQTPAAGWMTRKVEVRVTTHMKVISLDLTHKK
jgi:hypothetical protein